MRYLTPGVGLLVLAACSRSSESNAMARAEAGAPAAPAASVVAASAPAAASAPTAQAHALGASTHADAGPRPHAAFVPPAGPDRFGIGGGEADTHTHVAFKTPKGLVRASVHVVVDEFPTHGLTFFALQVDFPNHTWAHGGFQTHTEKDGTKSPTQFNWCGLVNRGGGSKDYKEADPKKDLDSIQCASGGSASWQAGVPYEYVVERGQQLTLPPGDYAPNLGGKKYAIDHPRKMWEWWFTVTPLSGGAPIYRGVIYDSADTISSFMVWNENGYGSQAAEQHTTWWGAKYRTADAPTTDQTPSKWSRD